MPEPTSFPLVIISMDVFNYPYRETIIAMSNARPCVLPAWCNAEAIPNIWNCHDDVYATVLGLRFLTTAMGELRP